MRKCAPGMIQLFHSLDSFTHYLRAYCDKLRREGHLPQQDKNAGVVQTLRRA